jgi:hypothetical protein
MHLGVSRKLSERGKKERHEKYTARNNLELKG